MRFSNGSELGTNRDLQSLIEAVIEALASRSGPTLLIHGNYLRADLELPTNMSVVDRPSIYAAFGHEPHPFRQMLDRGIRISLGYGFTGFEP